ncbi:MAG: hypothetical protein Q4E86_01070 [Lachnospiraceae bacterium]|nr:hypothetical protein [Lachnospiraceae bacterium]
MTSYIEELCGIKNGLGFITPYVLDITSWLYPKDVMHFDAFPARAFFMMFARCRLGMQTLLDLYESLPPESADEEAQRNASVRVPIFLM